MEEIKQELLEFNVDSKGIIYWVEAIKIIKEKPTIWSMIDIYEEIAKKYNSTYSCVERAMTHAIKPAKKNIQNKYKYYRAIRNQTFLSLIKYKLI